MAAGKNQRNSNRPERVGKAIQEEITLLLQRGKLKDPRVAMASISEVRVTKDLKNAKVYVQVIGSPEEREATVTGLKNAAGFIRRELSAVMSMRQVPELRFIADDTAERADRVLGLLAGIAREREAKEPPPPSGKKKASAASDDDEDDSDSDDDSDE
ncbi:MAG TPA: 30S ribosome-binding factor RbfA [bacterium]|nr:30S ribosome-binding factor RbfA [bacterium]